MRSKDGALPAHKIYSPASHGLGKQGTRYSSSNRIGLTLSTGAVGQWVLSLLLHDRCSQFKSSFVCMHDLLVPYLTFAAPRKAIAACLAKRFLLSCLEERKKRSNHLILEEIPRHTAHSVRDHERTMFSICITTAEQRVGRTRRTHV